MQGRPIVDPRLLASLSVFYPSLATIQQATSSQDAYGEATLTWAAAPGLAPLACSVAPINPGSPSGSNEYRRSDMTVATATHHIALQGYYPGITPAMRAVIAGGETWNILGVEHDSQGKTSRLKVERVTAP